MLVFYVYQTSVPSQRSDWNHDPRADWWLRLANVSTGESGACCVRALQLGDRYLLRSCERCTAMKSSGTVRECRLKYEWWDCHSLSSAWNLDGFLKISGNIKGFEDGFRSLCGCTRKISLMSLIRVPNKLLWQDKPGSSITKIIGDYCVNQYSILPTWELSRVMNFNRTDLNFWVMHDNKSTKYRIHVCTMGSGRPGLSSHFHEPQWRCSH